MSKIREEGFNILTQHKTRMHNERDLEIYKEARKAWNKKRLCYADLAKKRPELITHKNTQFVKELDYSHFLMIFILKALALHSSDKLEMLFHLKWLNRLLRR